MVERGTRTRPVPFAAEEQEGGGVVAGSARGIFIFMQSYHVPHSREGDGASRTALRHS